MPDGEMAAGAGIVRAAGAVLWRPGSRGLEVALIHRPRYDDWSLPKGKRQRGEHVLLTAVREVAEETGVAVVLGRRLRSTRYERDGLPKLVHYWAARRGTARQPAFQPNDEVDAVEWLPVPDARRRLSYGRDAWVLDDFATGPHDTRAAVLVRHAAAGSKEAWQAAGHDDDLPRPLDARGRPAVESLTPLLRCFGPGRVISSAAERCVATVRPLATRAGLPIEIEPAITVGYPPGSGSAGTGRTLTELSSAVAGADLGTVVCMHGEILPVLLELICAQLGAKAPDGPPLAKGEFWVLHIGGGVLAAAERHLP